MERGAYFDHSAIIEMLSGNKNVLKVLEEVPDFFTGSHVLALLKGAEEYMIKKKFWKEKKIMQVLGNFRVLEVGKGEAIKAGEIIGEMKTSGIDISLDEALTAAHVLLNGLILITADKELARKLKRINVQSKTI